MYVCKLGVIETRQIPTSAQRNNERQQPSLATPIPERNKRNIEERVRKEGEFRRLTNSQASLFFAKIPKPEGSGYRGGARDKQDIYQNEKENDKTERRSYKKTKRITKEQCAGRASNMHYASMPGHVFSAKSGAAAEEGSQHDRLQGVPRARSVALATVRWAS